MYLAGVSVRRVEDITEALWGTKVSLGTISNLNKKAYKHIETWRTRKLGSEYAYVYVDGVYLKHCLGGIIQNISILVAMILKAIHSQESKEAVREKAEHVAQKLREIKLSSAAKKVEDGIEETLTYMDFPTQHWSRVRTNNTIERLD